MARPKKEDAGKARQALIDSFWKLLAEIPYDKISVRTLSNYAGVNHNTFYRHFENIDDLAQQALKQSIPQELPSRFKEYSQNRAPSMLDFFDQERFQAYAGHARLFIMSGSLFLSRVLQEELKKTWLAYLGITEDELTPEEKLKVAFISGGMISAIRANSGEVNSKLIRGVLGDPLIDAVLNSLFSMGERAGN